MAVYYPESVRKAYDDVLGASVRVASQRSAYAGSLLQNAVVGTVESVAQASLPSIEAAAQVLAVSGGSAIAQAAESARLSALAQTTAAQHAREDILAGLLDPVFGIAQTAASDAAEEISADYADLLASEENAALAALAVSAVVTKGRGALCNNNSSVLGGVVSVGKAMTPIVPSGSFGNPATRSKIKVDRSNVQFILEVDGKALDKSYQKYIQNIVVSESCDHKLSKIKIDIINEQNRFGDDRIWDRFNTIKLMFGYTGTSLVPRGNIFYSMGPKITYGKGGQFLISIVGYGEEFQLGRTEKRRTWINKTDSQIVQEIAAEYGWNAEVDETEELYEHVAQVNESDWKFLDRRARYYGYQVYVDHWKGNVYSPTPTLHFHAPRYESSDLSLTFMAAQDSQLNGFSAWEMPLQSGDMVESSQVDPFSKEVFTVSSQEIKDEITTKTEGAFKGDSFVSSQQLTSFGGSQSTLYMFEEGQRQSSARLQEEVEGFSQFTRWMVGGSGSTIALETLRVRTILDLIGVGRDSGEYYIKDLQTTVKSGEASSHFSVARTWRGVAKGSRVEQKAIEPTKAGQVSVA